MRTAWSWLLPESAINRMSGPRHWPFIPDFWKGRRPWQQPAIWQGLIKMEPWHTREISGTLSRGRILIIPPRGKRALFPITSFRTVLIGELLLRSEGRREGKEGEGTC